MGKIVDDSHDDIKVNLQLYFISHCVTVSFNWPFLVSFFLEKKFTREKRSNANFYKFVKISHLNNIASCVNM